MALMHDHADDEVDPSCGCPLEAARKRREAAARGEAPSGAPTYAPASFPVAPAGMAYAPSGDPSLTSGVPAPLQASGDFAFRANIQFLGVEPRINAAAFAAALAQVVNDRDVIADTGAAIRPSSVRAVVSARMAEVVTQAMVDSSDFLDTADAGGNAIHVGSSIPTWWVELTGTVHSDAPWRISGFNRALARALWRGGVLSWGATFGAYARIIPTDGGALLAQLNANGACSGARNYGAVVSAACTRVMPSAQATERQTCVIRTFDEFWLRPRVTFDREGPHFPAGTTIEVIAPTGAVSPDGRASLYVASVNGQRGYVSLSTREAEQCPIVSRVGQPFTSVGAVFDANDRLNPRNIYGNRFNAMDTSRGFSRTELDNIVVRPLAMGSPVEKFWLRRDPTFAKNGPQFNGGTGVYLLGRTQLRSGPRTLWLVAVPLAGNDSRFGYAAFTAADVSRITQTMDPFSLTFAEQ